MESLEEAFQRRFGVPPEGKVELGASGSNRRYFRLSGGGRTAIGVTGSDKQENAAFIGMARHFRGKGIHVPEVYDMTDDGGSYLQQDLGDGQLFALTAEGREKGTYSEDETRLLLSTIEALPKIQFEGAEGFDWNLCHPQKAFGPRMVMFDLNYFKYCFLKATEMDFNEVLLQDDFDHLVQDLSEIKGETFMYRDFQARNVMIHDDKPYFIDFQGGMQGPIYYDVASFVWQAKARYPEELRDSLVGAYMGAMKKYVKDIDEALFRRNLRLFVLFRTLQVLGSYGFRGYFEKKPHFLGSVPYAIDNLRHLIKEPFTSYPYLMEVLEKLTNMQHLYDTAHDKKLEVSIYSFAYKKGIPADVSGNGGGYVFDCRAINNPGKYDHFRQFNGTDPEVIRYLEDDGGVTTFLSHVYGLVEPHVKRFMERKFTHMQVCFGCTGGQHRSVYCAEHLAERLSRKFDVRIKLTHRELGIEKNI